MEHFVGNAARIILDRPMCVLSCCNLSLSVFQLPTPPWLVTLTAGDTNSPVDLIGLLGVEVFLSWPCRLHQGSQNHTEMPQCVTMLLGHLHGASTVF
jgi:hypothetical protein